MELNLNNILLLLLVVVIFLLRLKTKDTFTNSKTLDILDLDKSVEAFGSFDILPNYNYSIIKIDEAVGQIVKKALIDNNLKKIIKEKMVLIYNKIQNNNELKTYLKFINLINENGTPIFINEAESVVLANEVKIILIVENNKSYQIVN
jgi:hypothetical protein